MEKPSLSREEVCGFFIPSRVCVGSRQESELGRFKRQHPQKENPYILDTGGNRNKRATMDVDEIGDGLEQ
jgi:hypothetical protein